MANITRKQLVNALTAEGIADVIADAMGADVADVTATIDKMVQSANRKRVSKPSAETLRNRQIATELAGEINARGAEFTAAARSSTPTRTVCRSPLARLVLSCVRPWVWG